MPTIQKLFTLEVDVTKFLESCSCAELQEIQRLISTERYQKIINGEIKICLTDDYECVYHACMSNDCQKNEVLTRCDWGLGNCETHNLCI